MATILVVYGSSHGQTALIARNLAAHVRTLGADVVVHDVRSLPPGLEVSHYDAVIVGGRVHGGKHPRKLSRFVERNLEALRRMPSAFYSVSMVVARADGTGRAEAQECMQKFFAATGWRPTLSATFAGALQYTQYNFILRYLMKRIARAEGGATDTSRNHEYTDWNAVRRFGDAVAALILAPHAPLSQSHQQLPV